MHKSRYFFIPTSLAKDEAICPFVPTFSKIFASQYYPSPFTKNWRNYSLHQLAFFGKLRLRHTVIAKAFGWITLWMKLKCAFNHARALQRTITRSVSFARVFMATSAVFSSVVPRTKLFHHNYASWGWSGTFVLTGVRLRVQGCSKT